MGLTKVCCRCGEEKPGEEFSKDRSKRDGLYSCCKECYRDPTAKRHRTGNPAVASTIEGELAKVRLSNGEITLIDASDAEIIDSYWWTRSGGYAVVSGGSGICMHRLIMNAPEGTEIDHRNGNKLDNRRQNLRLVPASVNNLNRRPRKDNSSGYPGVCWDKREKRWRARGGRNIHLGYFDSPAEAYSAVTAFYERHYGLPFSEIAPVRLESLDGCAV